VGTSALRVNPKIQIPKPKQIPNKQFSKLYHEKLIIVNLDLFVIWSLEFGIYFVVSINYRLFTNWVTHLMAKICNIFILKIKKGALFNVNPMVNYTGKFNYF
jgi:hypothetical protein